MASSAFTLNSYSKKITDVYYSGACSLITEGGVDCYKMTSSGVLRATKDMIVDLFLVGGGGGGGGGISGPGGGGGALCGGGSGWATRV